MIFYNNIIKKYLILGIFLFFVIFYIRHLYIIDHYIFKNENFWMWMFWKEKPFFDYKNLSTNCNEDLDCKIVILQYCDENSIKYTSININNTKNIYDMLGIRCALLWMKESPTNLPKPPSKDYYYSKCIKNKCTIKKKYLSF